jgi:hypothetical protein
MSRSSASSSSSVSSDALSSPSLPCSESRGSSVSSGMREEYEDLLRYAVVMPVGFDAKMKAFKSNADDSGVVAAETIRSTPQPEPVRVIEPPLRPEGMINGFSHTP